MKERFKDNLGKPFFQLGIILVLLVFLASVMQFSMTEEQRALSPNTAWEVMASCVLFFSLVNAVFSLQTKARANYWRNSIFSFIALLLLGSGIAWLFTGVSLRDAGSIGWILFVFSFGYLIFLSIANIMRFVMELAQKQDKRLRGED